MDNVHSFSTFFLGWDLENLVFGPSKRENLRCDLENLVFEAEKCETAHIVSQKQQSCGLVSNTTHRVKASYSRLPQCR